MSFYYTLATIIALLLHVANRSEMKSKQLSMLCYSASIILLCHFAGARDLSVGTDTAGYAFDSYWMASHSSFRSFYFESSFSGWSPLFKVFCWGSVNLFHSFYAYLFLIELLIVLPTIVTCKRVLKSYSPFGGFIFVILFYPMSFNMMRQMIAMGILLLSFFDAVQGRLVRFMGFVLLAAMFHDTALIGLLLYPLMQFSRFKKISSGLKLIIFVIFGLTALVAGPGLLALLSSLSGGYATYLDGGEYTIRGSGVRTLVSLVGSFLLIGGTGWVFSRVSRYGDKLASDLRILSIVVAFGIACWTLSLNSFYLFRLAMYFLYFSIILVPYLCKSIADTPSRRALLLISICVLSIWAFDYYEIQGSNQVVPYQLSYDRNKIS